MWGLHGGSCNYCRCRALCSWLFGPSCLFVDSHTLQICVVESWLRPRKECILQQLLLERYGDTDVVDSPDVVLLEGQCLDTFALESDHCADLSDKQVVEVS